MAVPENRTLFYPGMQMRVWSLFGSPPPRRASSQQRKVLTRPDDGNAGPILRGTHENRSISDAMAFVCIYAIVSHLLDVVGEHVRASTAWGDMTSGPSIIPGAVPACYFLSRYINA